MNYTYANADSRPESRTVDHILHLQQIVRLPGAVEGSISTSASTPGPKRAARQQPAGLKMRFLPIGFGTGQPGAIGSSSSSGSDSDEETEDANVPDKFIPPTSLSPTPEPEQATPDSSSDDSASDSDVEMVDARPPLQDTKQNINKSSSKVSHSKRKLAEGKD